MPPGTGEPTTVSCPRCHASYVPPDGSLSNGTYQSACRSCGHRFMFRSVVQPKATIAFSVNGRQFTVDGNHDSNMTLNEFIREVAGLKGTKIMCHEGGCGCCVVAATRFDPVTAADITLAINSCLCPVWICDGWEITTTEGIGSARQGYHPIQSRLAENSGSQCGWCSPGMVMNMYSLLQETPMPTKQYVEDRFDGNLCRCTGYRPILDTMKSFAVDASSCDIEDVGKVCCKKGGQGCKTKPCKLPRPEPLYLVLRNGTQWVRPVSLEELYQLLDIYVDQQYMLVFGNTSTGYYKDGGPYDVYIDVRGVSELYSYSLSDPLEFGANVTLTQLADLLEQASSISGYEYCANHAAHVRKIAGTPIRNAGCWAGNIMVKHTLNDFPSDVFIMLETVGAQITVGSSQGTVEYTPLELMSVDMKGKAIVKVTLPQMFAMDVVRSFKIMPRSQNTLAMVNAGFHMRLDPDDNYRLLQRPSVLFGGMGAQQNHALATEAYLTDKQLGDPAVLAGALETLQGELIANDDPVLTSAAYRKALAVSLFYKFVLGALSDLVADRLKSGAAELQRPLSEGVQDYSSDPDKYPLTEPMPKRAATAQAAGEAQYTPDLPPHPDQLYGAFVISTFGNATVSSIDPSDALLLPGVIDFVTVGDIPEGGVNNFMTSGQIEPIFVESQVEYAGQALGLIVADSQVRADEAVKAVRVTYTNILPPLTDLEEAIEQESFFPKPGPDLIAGDAEGAIAGSPHVIEGEVMLGTQAHLNMETHTTVCTPHDEGMDIVTTTQWVDSAQKAVAQVLNTKVSQIQMRVKRLGGAYGSKITRNNQIAVACALAAYKLNKPVRIMTNFNTQMEMVGKRYPYVAKYQVGVGSDGKLNGVKATLYADCGHSPNDNGIMGAVLCMDNAYFCENWNVAPVAVKTNLPGNTYCRSPGTLPGIFIMEYIMEHVAKELDLDFFEMKKLNYYQEGQATPFGQILEHVNIGEMTTQLEASADLSTRKQEIEAFNQANRWKKRALAIAPVKWGVAWGPGLPYSVYLSVYNGDGSVALAHGGVECGQGINVKIIQVCAHELGIPMDMIYIRPTEDFANANSASTGGSVTAELCSIGVIECCKQIKERLEPYGKKKNWQDQVQAAFADGVDLNARHWVYETATVPNIFQYFCYGVTCTETELDVLTGQYQVPRCDIIYDAGESMNPAVSIGQVEGAYAMGLGYCFYEKTRYHPTTGQNLTNGTFEYKPPTTKDIAVDFRVTLLKDTPNPFGVLGSKAVGEPPMCGSCSAWLAVKHCAEAARKETEQDDYFRLDLPCTVENAQLSCLNDIQHYVLQ